MKNTLDPKFKLWLTLSIVAAILFSFSGLKLAFETTYTVQDDARQHVFWLQRLCARNFRNSRHWLFLYFTLILSLQLLLRIGIISVARLLNPASSDSENLITS